MGLKKQSNTTGLDSVNLSRPRKWMAVVLELLLERRSGNFRVTGKSKGTWDLLRKNSGWGTLLQSPGWFWEMGGTGCKLSGSTRAY